MQAIRILEKRRNKKERRGWENSIVIIGNGRKYQRRSDEIPKKKKLE